ncbi:hypothetical protein ABPG72_010806 [Tetrahymena utriculariae]
MDRKEVGNKNAQEEQKHLRKAFFIQLESQKEDLYSIYFNFLLIYPKNQQDKVYKKWMQYPQKNNAYILSIQKKETKKKLMQLYQKSSWEECKIKNLKWKEVEIEKDLIRIVMYETRANSQVEILQANRYSEFVIIHNVGSDQYEIQNLSLQNTEKLWLQEQALIESQNTSNVVDQQLIQNNQYLQNNSDQDINIISNISKYKTQLQEQEKIIFYLQQENQKNEQIIIDLNKQLIETQNNLGDTVEQSNKKQEEEKQIMYRLKTELDKVKTTCNQEKQINQELKDKLEKKEKELNIEKTKNTAYEQDNSKIYQEKVELHDKNLKLINELNKLSKEYGIAKINYDKNEKKYQKNKEKYNKLKDKIQKQKEDMNQQIQKCRNDIDYIQTQFSLKDVEIKDKDAQIKKLQESLAACEQNKQKYQQKYNNLKTQPGISEFSYEATIKKTLNFDDTPLNTNRESILQHRNYYKESIEYSVKKSTYDNQFDYGINHNTDYNLDSYQNSLIKLSIQEKSSLNKELSSQADIFTLQSCLKDSKISSKKDANQDSFIMQTLEKQKDFIQNCQSNNKQNNILDYLNQYEEQLKFENQIYNSLSQIESNTNLESTENQDQISSISQLSEDKEQLKSQKYSTNNQNSHAEKKNKDKNINKLRQFNNKSKNSPNKHQSIIKQQDPSKLLNSKYHKQKYLLQKKQNEKLLNKQLNNSFITKPHLKERVQEQIEKKKDQTGRQQLFQTPQYESNNKYQNINNLSIRSVIQVNKNHIKKEITKQQ